MSYLFFDTETTGLPDWKMPPEFEGQPHICQIGAIHTDESGKVKAEMNFIITPDGWSIPESATNIHGISNDDALKYGISIKGALSLFARMLLNCETLVAHNIKFDLFMLEIECVRSSIPLQIPDKYSCTMIDATNILQIPPTAMMLASGRKCYKTPNLQETYHHFHGVNFVGAHDAMADVRACKDVFFKMKALKEKEAA